MRPSMDEQLKQRIVGAAVLIALAVIFIPFVISDKHEGYQQAKTDFSIPLPPQKPQVVVENDEFIPQPIAKVDLQKKISKVKTIKSITAKLRLVKPKIVKQKTVKPAKVAKKKVKLQTKAKARVHTQAKTVHIPLRLPVEQWVVQLASYSQVRYANAMRTQLQQKGFNAFTMQIKNAHGKRITRLLVGPEKTRAQADKLAARVKSATHMNGYVISYRGKKA